MIAFIARRAVLALLTTFVAFAAAFVAIRALPNNPVLARFGQHAVPEQVVAKMDELGWDRPVWRQFIDFLVDVAATGDLGESFFYPERVVDGLARTFPATVELTLAALLIAVPLGIVAGVAAAVWHNRWPDYLCMAGALVGVSVPVFFLGILLMVAFQNMPTGGRLPLAMSYDRSTEFIVLESLLRGRWDVAAAALRHLCLPALALSSIPTAVVARVARSSMLDVLGADYVRTARAKGSAPQRVVFRHALPNASIPIANIAGLQLGQLLSGAVLTESVFNWPGMGTYLVAAVQRSDYNVVQGGVLLVAIVFVTLNLALDVLYVLLDPRLRHAPGAQ